MYKVMIVDDEIIARVGIKSIIPWQEHGFELVGEFENGKKALEMARELLPDIIITDIRMPVLDGIELIKSINNGGIDAKIIVLSSYGDFDYVKEAMRLGAEDYILKLEMEPEKLIGILERVVKKIKDERSHEQENKRLKEHYRANIPVLKEKFLKDLAFGKVTDDREIEESLRLLNSLLNEKNLICLSVVIENIDFLEGCSDKDMDILKSSITNTLEDMVLNWGTGHVFSVRESTFGIIISLNDSLINSDISSSISRLTKSIKELLKNLLNLSVSVGVSDICQHYSDIREAYIKANVSAEKSVAHFKHTNSEQPAGSETSMISTIPLEEDLIMLENSFRMLDVVNIDKLFDTVRQKVVSLNGVSKKYLNGICHTVIFIINTFSQNNGIPAKDIWGQCVDPYKEIEGLRVQEDYIGWIGMLKDRISSLLNEDKDSRTIILKAKQYIKKNYVEEVTLETIAEHLGLSASYFSRLFSKETGECFTDYLTEIRIQAAKELLKNSNCKVYEVSGLVGYDNPHYFSRIFKKVTGVAPLEFKAEVVRESRE